jgi:predicted MFS family arabinose efflux permease
MACKPFFFKTMMKGERYVSTTRFWDTAYERKAIVLLTLGFGLVGLDRWVLPPLFPAMMIELHLNYRDLGNLVGVLGITWGVSSIVMGGLSDRIGHKRVLVPAVAVFSLLSAFSGMATGLVSLLLARAIMGAAEGAVAPTSVAVALEASHPTRLGMNSGLYQCALALFGLAIAPIVATQLLEVTSWRNVFLIVGVPGLIVAVMMWVTIREPRTIPSGGVVTPKRAPLSQIFRHRNVLLAMGALLCAMTGVFVLSAITPSYLVDYLNLTSRQMGFVTSGIGFGGFLGQLVVLTLSDFIGRRLATLSCFACAAVFLWLFIYTGANPAVLFVLLFSGAFFTFGALAVIAGPIAAEAAPLGLVATVAGTIIGAGDIFGGGVAPVIAGRIAQHYGIQFTPYFALAGLIGGLVVSLFLHETAPRRSRTAAVLQGVL